MIVIEYQNFGNAQDNVGQEADSLAAITRDSNAFSSSQGARIRGAIATYVRAVVVDEWPDLREGHESGRASEDVNAISVALLAVIPTSPQATAFYNDSVSQLNEALIARRNRLGTAAGGVPSLVLTLMLVGALVILGYVMLVGSRSFWFHAVGACSIALVVALSLVVLVELRYPFSGSLVVSSDPFKAGVLAEFFHRSRSGPFIP